MNFHLPKAALEYDSTLDIAVDSFGSDVPKTAKNVSDVHSAASILCFDLGIATNTSTFESQTKRPLGGWSKRSLDIVLSLFGLVLLAPALVLIWILVRMDGKGPGIFCQRRGGHLGNTFLMYKFRTMKPHDGPLIQAVKGDHRITKIGGFLRQTSLDELPQLYNILIGDMSLVGPRPHALAHDRLFASIDPNYNTRFLARPGLTGLAQIRGARGLTDTKAKIRRRLAYDLNYIKTWGLMRDLGIILWTVKVVIHDKTGH